MTPLIVFVVVIVIVLLIIWWWNSRDVDEARGEQYHASPFAKTAATPESLSDSHASHAPAAPPSEDHHPVGGGPSVEPVMAEPHAAKSILTESAIAESLIAEPEAPAAGPVAEAPTPAPQAAATPNSVAELVAEPVVQVTAPAPIEAPPVVEAPSAPTPVAEATPSPEPVAAKAPVVEKPGAPPTTPDDLEVIEGIGPKISGVLKAAGVTTFAQLAAMKPDAIKQIITEGGVKIGDPATWPQQAKLAAEGKWDRLKTLQDKLQGGRKA